MFAANLRPVLVFVDTSTTAAATTTGYVDTLDTNTNNKYEFCQFAYREATVNVVSNKPTVLKIQESDDTVVSNAVNIVALTGGTATSATVGFVITAPANTSVTNMTVFNIDCRSRKRYLHFSVSPATTQIVGCTAVLGRGKNSPVTATAAGVKQVVG